MSRLLFGISDTFWISGRGLVIATDVTIREAETKGINLKVGDVLELRRPDGAQFITNVAGIEFLCPSDPERPFVLSLSPGILKEQVPVGTEVWSEL